jgi:hypothetical protein
MRVINGGIAASTEAHLKMERNRIRISHTSKKKYLFRVIKQTTTKDNT